MPNQRQGTTEKVKVNGVDIIVHQWGAGRPMLFLHLLRRWLRCIHIPTLVVWGVKEETNCAGGVSTRSGEDAQKFMLG